MTIQKQFNGWLKPRVPMKPVQSEWKLRKGPTIKVDKFVATFPEYPDEGKPPFDPPPYIKLYNNVDGAYVLTRVDFGAVGREIQVNMKTIDSVSDNQSISWEATSALSYYLSRLWYDPRQRVVLYGTIIAGAGIIIDGIIAIGNVRPIFSVGASKIAFAMGVSLAFKLIGAVMLLWKAMLESKQG